MSFKAAATSKTWVPPVEHRFFHHALAFLETRCSSLADKGRLVLKDLEELETHSRWLRMLKRYGSWRAGSISAPALHQGRDRLSSHLRAALAVWLRQHLERRDLSPFTGVPRTRVLQLRGHSPGALRDGLQESRCQLGNTLPRSAAGQEMMGGRGEAGYGRQRSGSWRIRRVRQKGWLRTA